MTERPFTYDVSDDGTRLGLHGDLDEGATLELRALVTKGSDGPGSGLTVDLSDVDLLPSAAIGVLARARDEAVKRGDELTFVAAPGTIAQRILTICELPYSES